MASNLATKREARQPGRPRKVRTREVSSSSESDSSSSVSSSSSSSSSDSSSKASESDSTEKNKPETGPNNQVKTSTRPSKKRKVDAETNGDHSAPLAEPSASNGKTTENESQPKSPEDEPSAPEEPSPAPVPPPRNPITKDPFEAWYMRAITREFGEDLDKVRSAPDFKQTSVPVLINALKQGVACFTAEERSVILGEMKQ